MKKIIIVLAALLVAAVLNAQTITTIQYDSLPAPVREQLQKKYSKYKVSGIKKSVAKDSSVTYLVEARMQQNPKTVSVVSLVYFPSGTLLSSKKEKEISYTGYEPVHDMPHNQNDGHNH